MGITTLTEEIILNAIAELTQRDRDLANIVQTYGEPLLQGCCGIIT